MNSRRDSATRFVIAIVTVGLVAFLVVVYTGVQVTQRLAESRAVDQARNATEVEARVVESRINNGVLTGHAIATREVANLIGSAVLPDDSVERVKIWRVEDGVGEIIYSDDVNLIGDRENLGDEELEVLATEGAVVAEVSDLEDQENRSE